MPVIIASTLVIPNIQKPSIAENNPQTIEIEQKVDIPTLTPNVQYGAIGEATEAIVEPNVYSSCVATARQIYPKAPNTDAIEYKSNGTVENSEILIMQYPSKYEEGKFVYHIAPYKLGTSTLHIYNEGNYVAGEKTERDILFDDEHIIGYFDIDLWLKIQELPKSAIDTLQCESGFKHYNSDGSVMRGNDGEFGIGQFMKGTWGWFTDLRRKEKLPLLDILNPADQIKMVAWAWDNGFQEHWSCYKNIYPE